MQEVVLKIRVDKTQAVAAARALPREITEALKGLNTNFGQALVPAISASVATEAKKVTRAVTASMDEQKKAQFDLHKISTAEYQRYLADVLAMETEGSARSIRLSKEQARIQLESARKTTAQLREDDEQRTRNAAEQERKRSQDAAEQERKRNQDALAAARAQREVIAAEERQHRDEGAFARQQITSSRERQQARGRLAGDVGMPLMLGGAAVLGGLDYATQQAAKFQTTLVQMRNNTQMTDQEFAAFQQHILQMGQSTGASMDQMAEAFMRAKNHGLNMAESMKVVDAATRSALATGADIGETANVLSQTLHIFHLSADQADNAMNTLHQAQLQGNTTMTEFVQNFGLAEAVTSKYGLTLQDTAAITATMTENGLNMAEAGTQIRDVMQHITNPVKKAREEIEALSKRTGVDLVGDIKALQNGTGSLTKFMIDLNAATHGNAVEINKVIPAQRGAFGAMALTGKASDDLRTNFGQLGDTMSGKLDPVTAGFTRQQQTLEAQTARLNNTLQVLYVKVGTSAIPALKEGEKAATSIGDAFNKLDSITQQDIVDSAAFVGVIALIGGGALTTASKVISLVSDLREMGVAFGGVTTAAEGAAGAETGMAAAGLAAFGLGSLLVAALVGLGIEIIALANDWDTVRAAQDQATASAKRYADVQKNLSATGERGALEVNSQQIAQTLAGRKEALTGYEKTQADLGIHTPGLDAKIAQTKSDIAKLESDYAKEQDRLNQIYIVGQVASGGKPSASQQSSYAQIVAAARAAGDPHPNVTAAQWALESGYGKHQAGRFNFFGQKATASQPGTVRESGEVEEGRSVMRASKFRDYDSLDDGIKDHLRRWNHGAYAKAGSDEQAAYALQSMGYATDPNYAAKLLGIMHAHGGDASAPSPVSNRYNGGTLGGDDSAAKKAAQDVREAAKTRAETAVQQAEAVLQVMLDTYTKQGAAMAAKSREALRQRIVGQIALVEKDQVAQAKTLTDPEHPKNSAAERDKATQDAHDKAKENAQRLADAQREVQKKIDAAEEEAERKKREANRQRLEALKKEQEYKLQGLEIEQRTVKEESKGIEGQQRLVDLSNQIATLKQKIAQTQEHITWNADDASERSGAALDYAAAIADVNAELSEEKQQLADVQRQRLLDDLDTQAQWEGQASSAKSEALQPTEEGYTKRLAGIAGTITATPGPVNLSLPDGAFGTDGKFHYGDVTNTAPVPMLQITPTTQTDGPLHTDAGGALDAGDAPDASRPNGKATLTTRDLKEVMLLIQADPDLPDEVKAQMTAEVTEQIKALNQTSPIGGSEFWGGLREQAGQEAGDIVRAILNPKDRKNIGRDFWKWLGGEGESVMSGIVDTMTQNLIKGGLKGILGGGGGKGPFSDLPSIFEGAKGNMLQGAAAIYGAAAALGAMGKKKQKHSLFGAVLGGIAGSMIPGVGVMGGMEFGGAIGGMFAGGGRPPVGKMSIVGEKGWEPFIPDAPGRILSHADAMRALGTKVAVPVGMPAIPRTMLSGLLDAVATPRFTLPPALSLPPQSNSGISPQGLTIAPPSRSGGGDTHITINDHGDKIINTEMDIDHYARTMARKMERAARSPSR